ncbi:citryl-CoA lyase [Massilia sp. W12]|uniref:citryl-CoA lyase n=1 Tax=Massilia sp. W12 TaxID=3126507 RepID=UPI0030CF0A6A
MGDMKFKTEIWKESAAADNPFTAETVLCCGYDVYGDLLEKIGFLEYLYLLVRRQKPSPVDIQVLQILSVALGNPGPRDPSVHAAMCSGVGKSPASATMFAALACGSGQYGGGHEILLCMQRWQKLGQDLTAWQNQLSAPPPRARELVWPDPEHPPGFCAHDKTCAKPVLQTMQALCKHLPQGNLAWLAVHQQTLEQSAQRAFSMSGVAAATFHDLGFDQFEAEMIYMLLRLPGAMAHALEQSRLTFRQFPYFELELLNDPGNTAVQEN